MLKLILGEAGTGKTREIYRRIAQLVRSETRPPIFLIVPEQYSFESERALCELLGERLALHVQVLSFTRLCHKVFYQYGQVAGNFVDQTGKYLLMSLAVEQVRDALTSYRAQSERTSFVPVVLDLVSEFKNAGAMPEQVIAAAKECQSEKLGDKLYELGTIYQAYQALLERSYRDPADDIARAMKLSAGRGYFSGAAVFLDSFAALMSPELQFIRQMLEEGATVTAAACCDGLTGADGVFAPVLGMIHQLQDAARRAGVPVASPEFMPTSLRAQNDALRHLSHAYLREKEPFTARQSAIQVIEAGDVFDEARFISEEINRLIYDHGYRYREIAVITRSLTPYADAFETAFSQARIPAYFDRRENAESYEVTSLILSALLGVQGSYDTSQLISLSKLPLLGIPEDDAFELENYCYVWNVRGRLWLQPFGQNPDGLGETMTDASRERLARIERARQTLMGPLIRLREALEDPCGTNFAHGVWSYLTDSGALERLQRQSAANPQHAYVDVQSALFDRVVDILDLFDRLLGRQRLSKTRLIDLWRLAVQSCEVGKLPQTLDQVIVGTADRIRPSGIRTAFVCGAVEGEFPLRFSGAGLISDREREELQHGGLRLNVAKSDLAALERFYTYFAVTVPSERLIVTFPTRAVAGEEKRPSVLARAVAELFPGCTGTAAVQAAQDPLGGMVSRKNVYSKLCSSWGADTELYATLEDYFAGSPESKRLSLAVERVSEKSFTIGDRKVARRLFGQTQALSPSRMETYFGCAFAYFCDSGLRLKKKRRAEFSPLESGSLIHYVLEVLVRKYCTADGRLPAEKELRDEIAQLITDYLAQRVEDVSAMDERFHYLFKRLCGMLSRLTRRLFVELRQSSFRPYAFELPIDLQAENQPLVLSTPGGNRVFVRGIVDRVDVCEASDGKYLRVVDYKSGAKVFHLTDVYYGLNMQMLLYLFTLTENGDHVLRGAIPAGVLYLPAREGSLTVERKTPPEEIAAMRADGYKMNGLLLDNISVLERMERDLSGVFIPAKLKKDGSLDSQSKVASLEQFGRLRKRIEKLVCEMADHLIDGQVAALPASGLGYDPCEYCDFRPVCRREEHHPKRELVEMSEKELFEQLRGEEEETDAGGILDTGTAQRN